MESFLITGLMIVSLVCQTYNAYQAFSFNSLLGLQQNKGWYIISCSFGVWAFNRLYALFIVLAGDVTPTVGGQLLQTALTIMLAVGLYLLKAPYREHAKSAKAQREKAAD